MQSGRGVMSEPAADVDLDRLYHRYFAPENAHA
jgi:hypothetical protein